MSYLQYCASEGAEYWDEIKGMSEAEIIVFADDLMGRADNLADQPINDNE